MRTQPRIFSYAPVNVTGKMFGKTDVKTPFLFFSFLNRPISSNLRYRREKRITTEEMVEKIISKMTWVTYFGTQRGKIDPFHCTFGSSSIAPADLKVVQQPQKHFSSPPFVALVTRLGPNLVRGVSVF